MKWTEGKPTNITLIGLTLFSILIFFLAEQTAEPERQPYFEKKLEAAQLSLVAMHTIKNHTDNLGIKIDLQNDPYSTGIIGQENTQITSDRGIVTSKILSTNPNYAAAFVDMLIKAKVKKRSIVAVGMTGSFPGWNISFLAACKVMELKPIVISSVGASDWGANIPTLTWLDMESVLKQKGIFPFTSSAASIGGGSDNGRGLSPEGRDLIKEAIKRNNVHLISEPSLEGNIDKRMELYTKLTKNQSIACYINIGGGVASVGGSQNTRLIPPGVTQHLAVMNFPVRAVINRMAEQGLPVINLLEVEKIALKYNFPTEVGNEPPKLGEGPLFFKDRYSVSGTIMLTIFLAFVVFVLIRIDVKHYLFKRNRPNSLRSKVEPFQDQKV
ncbi:MAG: poly-gamma-glutamate system protein [Bacteroidota bacterium]|nr:poly-gamma-glutamate system protein [Bacteroidota bacterium]